MDFMGLEVPSSLHINQGNPSDSELVALCQGAGVMLVEHTVISPSVLERCPSLRAIVFMGTGAGTYVPMETARRLGVQVLNTPGYANLAVAEHAIALLMAAARNVARMDREIRSGIWVPRGGLQLRGRKIAVVGLGEVGRTCADIAQALGMEVAGWNHNAVDVPYFQPDLDVALGNADAVTLHLALNEQTTGLIGRHQLGLLRYGAILVNTARAQLVDQTALRDALASGHIGHAALDVFVEEPLPAHSDWRHIDNLTMTAHAAYMTDDAYAELWRRTLIALKRVDSL